MSITSQHNSRLEYLDIAKGIGIVLVMLSHSCGFPWGGYYFTAFYMVMFFIISGYTYKSGKNIKENIYKRFKRLVVPYIGFNAFLFLYYIVFSLIADTYEYQFNIKQIIGILYSRYCLFPLKVEDNIFLNQIQNQTMWFLTGMIVSSTIFFIIVEKCFKNRYFCIGISISFMVITCLLSILPILLPWSIDTAFVGAFFMIIGALLGKKRYFDSKFALKNLFICLVIGILYINLCNFNPGINMSVRDYGEHGYLSVLLFIIIGINGSVLIIWFSKLLQKNIGGKLLSIFGKNTIVLLSVHLLLYSIIDLINTNFFHLDTSKRPIYFLYGSVKVFLAIAICLISIKVWKYLYYKINFSRNRKEINN